MGLRKFKKSKYLKMFGGWDDGPSHCIYYKNWWKYFKEKKFPKKLPIKDDYENNNKFF